MLLDLFCFFIFIFSLHFKRFRERVECCNGRRRMFSNISTLIFFFLVLDSCALLIDARSTCVCTRMRICVCYVIILDLEYLLMIMKNHIEWHVWALLLLFFSNVFCTSVSPSIPYYRILHPLRLHTSYEYACVSVNIKFIRKFHSMLGH